MKNKTLKKSGDSKKRPRQEESAKKLAKTDGLNEIDTIFDDKKQHKKQRHQHEEKQERQKKRKRQAQQEQSNNSRQDLLKLKDKEWKDDGLGGKYNNEGFTGRREDGVKVYKAHLLNERDFGNTPDCPFDCSCCYI
jgi:hypothetical protein